jgi:hypothetical protein
MHEREFHCPRILLVYLEKRVRHSSHGDQKQGSTSRSSTDENGIGLRLFSRSQAPKIVRHTPAKNEARAQAHKIRGVIK